MKNSMKSVFGLIALSILLNAPVAQARLVIIQDDEARRAEIAKEERLAQERKAEAQRLQKQQEMQEQQRAVREATVDFVPDQFKVVADRTEKIIHHFGVPPQSLPAHGGAGLESPLWLSLNGIVPKGWRVYTEKDLDPQLRVDWNGSGKNWVAILYELGVVNSLTYDVDWNQKLVLVKKRRSATDYLRDEMQKSSHVRTLNITVETDGNEPLPQMGEGVLFINGKTLKVKNTEASD